MTPSRNQVVFQQLVEDGGIDIESSPLFEQNPDPVPDEIDFDRVEGLLWGLAIGDALGRDTEGMQVGERRAHHGEITDYNPNGSGRADSDSQMAFLMLDQMLNDGRLDAGNVAARWTNYPYEKLGDTIRAFIGRHNVEHLHWSRAGMPSAGNGAVMRIAPIVIPHLRSPSFPWIDAALAGMITHNDGASIASCVAISRLAWDALTSVRTPLDTWWLDRSVATIRWVEPIGPYEASRCSGEAYRGRLSRYLDEEVRSARQRGLSVAEACDCWGSGAYLFETMPAVIYILEKHGHDFEEAMVRAINDTWDNNTIAAIIGAILGGVHGKSAIPERWIDGHCGWITEDVPGQIDDIIERTRVSFWRE